MDNFLLPGSFLGLAGGAPDGGSLGDEGFSKLGSAALAGQAASAVDAMSELERAGGPVEHDMIPQGRPASRDRFSQDSADVSRQGLDGVGLESVGRGLGVDLSAVEGFVGVDVADASEDGLVEQGGFDGSLGGLEGGLELSGGHGQGVGAEGGPACGGQFLEIGEGPDSAKASGVGHLEGGVFVEVPADVGVWGGLEGVGGSCGERSGHAQVEAEGGVL